MIIEFESHKSKKKIVLAVYLFILKGILTSVYFN